MTFAVVNIAGFQEKVVRGMKLKVPTLSFKEGEKFTLDQVLLVSDGKNVQVGKPHVSGASVEAKVLGAGRHEKIRVFKMKHRKRYRRTQGHRQGFTEIEIVKIKS